MDPVQHRTFYADSALYMMKRLTKVSLVENRYCEKCMMRTEHELIVDTRGYNPRGRGNYKCIKCGRVKSMRHLRPSSEIGY